MSSAFHKIATLRLARRLTGPLMRGRASIFFLHRRADPLRQISGHTETYLREVIGALRCGGAKILSIRELIAMQMAGNAFPPNSVAFSLDDGFRDQYEMAKNVFVSTGTPVTIFPIGGMLDGNLWPWDDQLAHVFRLTDVPACKVEIDGDSFSLKLETVAQRNESLSLVRNRIKRTSKGQAYARVHEIARILRVEIPIEAPVGYEPMTWPEARELESLGVDFGIHTVSHQVVSGMDPELVRHELSRSWASIRTELKDPLPVVAWPTGAAGDYSSRDEGIAESLGLVAAFNAVGDFACSGGPRVGFQTFSRFALPPNLDRVLEYSSWLERAKQLIRPSRAGR